MKKNGSNINWHSTLLPINSSFEDALKSLDNSKLKVALIVNNDKKLLGTLTDGDIRRAFLKGCTLSEKISNYINHNPIVVSPKIKLEEVFKIMKKNLLQQLPIISDNGEIKGLHTWNEINEVSKKDNFLVIMAGGQGTRLRPMTDTCPKPMLKVAGKPMLEHIILKAKRFGFNNIFISLYHLGNVIEDYFGNGLEFGVKIKYLKEDCPLGTAGSLGLLTETINAPIIVTNGDILTNIDYVDLLDFHIRNNSFATMAVRQHQIQNPYGVVKTNELDIVGFEEKPIYHSNINAGIYAISPEALSFIKKGTVCDMPTLFNIVKKNKFRTMAYSVHEKWLDIGQPLDLNLARNTYDDKL